MTPSADYECIDSFDIRIVTSCIPSGLVSRDCYRIVPCRASPVYDVSDKLRSTILVRCVHSRGMTLNRFQQKKMETRHPVEGLFCSEFPSIYNQCGVMDA